MKDFAYGVDLGWVSKLEEMGYHWCDDTGKPGEILDIMKNYGVNAVRLRLFVDPPKEEFWDKTPEERCMLGKCDLDSVIKMASRIVENGFELMLDVHYSDVFADPAYQLMPKAWEGHDLPQLIKDVDEYTVYFLNKFKENNIAPAWVQVGNEINPGMMLPVGNAEESMDVLVKLLNAGYDAVKKVFPDTQVITHLANGAIKDWIEKWFDSFFANGGKTDIIGLSHYPYWYAMIEDAEMTDLGENMNGYYEKYGKPLMVVEVGEREDEEDKSYDLLKKTMADLESLPDGKGLGLFYWEPEVGMDVLPDKYPLGAARLIGEKEIKFNRALKAYRC